MNEYEQERTEIYLFEGGEMEIPLGESREIYRPPQSSRPDSRPAVNIDSTLVSTKALESIF